MTPRVPGTCQHVGGEKLQSQKTREVRIKKEVVSCATEGSGDSYLVHIDMLCRKTVILDIKD